MLEPDFDILGALRSFSPKGAAEGAASKVPLLVSKYLAGDNLTALNKQKKDSVYDIRPIAVGEVLRRLIGKCLC